MSLKSISTSKAPAAIGPYSQAVQVNNMLYTSGQLPIDMETGELESFDMTRATKLCMENVKAILSEAGTDLNNVVKTIIFVKSMDDFDEINAAYAEYFPEIKPARSCIEISRLPKDAKMEIEVIAIVK